MQFLHVQNLHRPIVCWQHKSRVKSAKLGVDYTFQSITVIVLEAFNALIKAIPRYAKRIQEIILRGSI